METNYDWYKDAARCMKFLCDEMKIDNDNARGMVSYICGIIIRDIETMEKKGGR